MTVSAGIAKFIETLSLFGRRRMRFRETRYAASCPGNLRVSINSEDGACPRLYQRLQPSLRRLVFLHPKLAWPGATASRQVRAEGSIFCGLSSELGLKQARSRFITWRSDSEKRLHIRSCFSIPTPCSPVIDPPTPIQNSSISRPAPRVRCVL